MSPSHLFALTVKVEQPTISWPDQPTESFMRYAPTGELVVTIRGAREDVQPFLDAIRPLMDELAKRSTPKAAACGADGGVYGPSRATCELRPGHGGPHRAYGLAWWSE